MTGLRIAAGAICALAIGAAQTLAAPCITPDNQTHVTGGKECLVIKAFRSEGAISAPVLFVVLHGDGSAGGPVDYHYAIAQKLAHSGVPNVIAVAMLRPGYYDRGGNTSSGSDFGRRDSYTAEYIDDIAGAISVLKTQYGVSRVILVGHSGGATISAVIIGRHPILVSAAVLVSCSCDIAVWRRSRNLSPSFQSESPINYAKAVPPQTKVVALVGALDQNTWPYISEAYVAELRRHGVPASFALIPNTDHLTALGSPHVIEAALALAKSN